MKVRYIDHFTDSYGDIFQPGWIAEHEEPDAIYRISLGVCEEVTEDGAKSLKLQEEKPLFTDCASPEYPEDDMPLREVATPRTSTNKRLANK